MRYDELQRAKEQGVSDAEFTAGIVGLIFISIVIGALGMFLVSLIIDTAGGC